MYEFDEDSIYLKLLGLFTVDSIRNSEINRITVISGFRDRFSHSLRYGTKTLNLLQAMFYLVKIEKENQVIVIAPMFPRKFVSQLRKYISLSEN